MMSLNQAIKNVACDLVKYSPATVRDCQAGLISYDHAVNYLLKAIREKGERRKGKELGRSPIHSKYKYSSQCRRLVVL